MRDLAPLRVFLARKTALKSSVENVHEILFYLKNQYLPHNEERAFIEDIPQFTFEAISDSLKTFSKSIKEVEHMSLENTVSLGGWISTAAKIFRRHKNVPGKNLPGRFEDWM